MPNLTDDFIVLCTRTLSGEASGEEHRKLKAFLQDPECQAYYEALELRWKKVETPPRKSYDADRAFQRLAPKLAPSSSLRRPEPRLVPFDAGRFLRRAVAMAALVAVGFALWLVWSHQTAQPVHWAERRAAVGTRTTLTLTDGTRVTLNGDSTLSYPDTFGETRVVRLTGEAYFDVVHDPAHPFVVEAGGLKTTVLGTRFNVNAFAGDSSQTVSLVEGRVKVGPIDPTGAVVPATLLPGQRFSFDRKTGRQQVGTFDAESTMGWMNGLIVLKDERLDLAVKKIEHRFGVKIELVDAALAEKTVNAHFEKETLGEILDILAFTGNMRCELVRKDGEIAGARLFAQP